MDGLSEWCQILVTGIWVGNEDRAAHFRATRLGQGATMALPIWGIFMKNVMQTAI